MQPTDSMFNSDFRQILAKLVIFFGEDDDVSVLEVTQNNYLISLDIDEDTWGSSASSLFDNISPNTLDFTLANTNRIFSPTNELSPYYGKIKPGIKVEAYMTVHEADYLPMGIYYVTDWNISDDGMNVSVYASDKMMQVLKSDSALILPQIAPTYREFYQYYFAQLGFSADVDTSLVQPLQWGISTGNINSDLSELSQATWTRCAYNRTGALQVRSLETVVPIRATITDSDQIIGIKAAQSINKAFNGVKLTYFVPISTLEEVLAIKDLTVAAGISEEMCFPFQRTPVVGIADIACQTDLTKTLIQSFRYTPEELFMCVNGTGIAQTTNLSVLGWYLNMQECVRSDGQDSMLEVSNRFIQYSDYASMYKIKLDRYASFDMPTIDVIIHGNLLLEIGDKIEVISEQFATEFLGKIIKISTNYDGSLTQTITLLDAAIIE